MAYEPGITSFAQRKLASSEARGIAMKSTDAMSHWRKTFAKPSAWQAVVQQGSVRCTRVGPSSEQSSTARSKQTTRSSL